MINISLSRIFSWKFLVVLLLIAVIALILFLRSNSVQAILESLSAPELPPIQVVEETVSVDQNWSKKVSKKFHNISQGTSTLPVPLEWLLALEQPETSAFKLLLPGANGAFTDNNYLRRLGFIPSEKSRYNPNGLPIGFATTEFQNLSGNPTMATSVGLTCAACHTGHFIYDKKEFIIEGGPATIDLDRFSKALGAALGQTLVASKFPFPNRRFDRFAKKVLGGRYSAEQKKQLAEALQSVLLATSKTLDTIHVTEGFGRLDALNRIGNQVFSKNIGHPQNFAPIDAPVNFPHIWTASWFDWVQYDGSIMQPLVRNAGEALGVHANIDMTSPLNKGRFSSNIDTMNLKWIENSLAGDTPPFQVRKFGGLQSPKWPQSLPKIDTSLRDKGAELYMKLCAGCHLPPLDSDEIWSQKHFQKIAYEEAGTVQETQNRYLVLKTKSLTKMGTDPAQANILDKRKVDTSGNVDTGATNLGINAKVCGVVGGQLKSIDVKDGPKISFAYALGAIVQQTNDDWFSLNNIPDSQKTEFEGDRPNCLRAGAGYKARPLNGIWATAPFLHNGSVPTLDDLLRPADERPTFVRLGTLEFDPVKVGIKQPDLSQETYPEYKDGYFILNTKLKGNLNTGHAFGASKDGDKTGMVGRNLSDDERAALIEYLKSL